MNPLDHSGIAYAEARRFRARGLDREDLVQAALLGLCSAARTYDPALGSFSHHARIRVRAELSAAVMGAYRRGRFGGFRLTRKVVFQLSRLERRGELTRETARVALTSSGTEFTSLTDHEIDLAIQYVRRGESSLDAPLGDDTERTLGETISDEPGPGEGPEKGLVGRDWYRVLGGVLEDLTPTARTVFERCVASEEPVSFAELARELGSTRQNISQVMNRIGQKTRAASATLLQEAGL